MFYRNKIIFTLLLVSMLTLGVVTPLLATTPEEAFLQESGLEKDVNISLVVSDLIKVVLGFLGVIFVVLIIYAGFMWMTSAGNEDKISKAKSIIVAAIIGLFIVLSAYAITYFVIDSVLEATQGGSGLG